MSTLHVGSNQLVLVIRELDIDDHDKKGGVQEHVRKANTSFVSSSVT